MHDTAVWCLSEHLTLFTSILPPGNMVTAVSCGKGQKVSFLQDAACLFLIPFLSKASSLSQHGYCQFCLAGVSVLSS